jgi:outer membrane protein assembly factor BamB
MTVIRAVRLVVTIALLLGHAACSGDDGGRPRAETPETAGEGNGRGRFLDLDEAWIWRPPPMSSAGMPAADNAGVAFVVSRHQLVLLDQSGRVRWQAEKPGLRDVAPVLTTDLVVAATSDGAAAFDRATGTLRWETVVDERVNTPVIAAGRAVATTWEGSLVAFDLAGGGKVAWRLPLGGASLGPAAAAGAGTTVVATFDSGRVAGLVAVDAATGRPRWTRPLPPDGVSAPGIAGQGRVVVAVAGDVAAHAFALEDGAPTWRTEVEGAGSPEVPPIGHGEGEVLVPHRQGGMALLDSATGGIRWEARSDSAAVRGGPAGPGPDGWFAMPLDDGTMLMVDARLGDSDVRKPPDGLVSGVAAAPGGLLIVATGQGEANFVSAMSGW